MKSELVVHLIKTAKTIGIEADSFALEYPENPEHGDYSTNIAMAYAKVLKMAPKALAEKIVEEFKKDMPAIIESVSVAGPGFINFKVKDTVFAESIINNQETKTKREKEESKNILIEYTDPNIFKAFHIGHLMSNAIGESLSRLIESSGAKVTRLCYPSDIGLHIAKSIWAMKRHESEIPADSASIQEKTAFLGKMYVEGTQMYESDEMSGAGITAKDDIDALNKILYEKSSPAVNALYEKGRNWSLEHFELLYKRLGTHFDGYIYESEMAPVGLDIVKVFLKKDVFAESDGAIVFKGEDHGLHTRVFINSHGLPTYEAKEMGLNVTKFKKYPETDTSIVVTASEQNEYFKVITKALTLIDENVGKKTKHIGHGMLRFASGKMSSRTGNVITAETLIDDMKKMVIERIADRKFTLEEAEEVSDMVAIAAIKYTILRQAVGSDVIFDSAKSISFEGDSGPYLQYSVVRANSIIEKAKTELDLGKEGEIRSLIHLSKVVLPEKVGLLEKLIVRFPDIVERASSEYAPQLIANYLINLAGAFNSFYASNIIVDADEALSPYRVLLTKSFVETMSEGLHILGIKIPKRM
ncbi:MAG TPA: arginine--tRNA ligase [Candidatus Paceibacterota bacterium]|jgi:arginyl-tRNA synthetase|nr:arginine--tRNA ligase [Candidatus Paceibacterota bacterium]